MKKSNLLRGRDLLRYRSEILLVRKTVFSLIELHQLYECKSSFNNPSVIANYTDRCSKSNWRKTNWAIYGDL